MNCDKIIVNKCDTFEMCKIVDRKIDYFEINSNQADKKLFKCVWSQCWYETNNESALNKHIVCHSDKTQYKCDFEDCNKNYKFKCDLRSHERTLHSGIKLCFSSI